MIIVSLSIFLQVSKCCDLFLSQTVLSVCLLLINHIKEFREFQPGNTVTAYHKPNSDCVFRSARSVSNNKLAPSEIVYCTAVKVVPKTPYFALPSPTGTAFSTSKQRLPKLFLHHSVLSKTVHLSPPAPLKFILKLPLSLLLCLFLLPGWLGVSPSLSLLPGQLKLRWFLHTYRFRPWLSQLLHLYLFLG